MSVNKVVNDIESVLAVEPGDLLAVGGVVHDNKPCELLRTLIRNAASGIRYITFSASGYDLDLLIAAGVVTETYVPAVSFDYLGLAPSFQSAAEAGTLRAHGVDVASVMAGYFASAEGIPFHPVTALEGTDLVKVNPLLMQVESPIDGSLVYVVPAIEPDVAVIHVQACDEGGNAVVKGSFGHAERMLARASKSVVLSTEEIVSTEVIERRPYETTIPAMYVDRVCLLPGGAYPTASPELYDADLTYLRGYLAAASRARRGDRDDLAAYLKFVGDCDGPLSSWSF